MARGIRWGRLAPPLAVLGLALTLFVPGVAAEPVPALRLEQLVPGRTLAFLSLDEVGRWGERAQGLALAKMAEDPEMKAFMAPIEAGLRKMMEPGGESPVPPMVTEVLQALSGLSGQVGVALVEVDPSRGPVAAAGLDFGAKLSEFVTFAERMKAQMGEDLGLTSETKEGRTWWTMGDPAHPMVHAMTFRTSVLLSTDRAWLEQVAASDGAAVPQGLGASEDFRRARASAGGDRLALFLYANVPGVLKAVADEAGPDARRMMDALGLDTMKSAAYGMSFVGDGILDAIVVEAPGADHGLMPIMKMRPATGKGLALAPANTFVFEESTFAFSTVLGQVREILNRIDPELLEPLEEGLAEARKMAGVDLEREFLGALADDLSYHVAMPETGGLFPEVVVSLAVKDPVAFEAMAVKAVDGLLATLGRAEELNGSQRVIEYRGKKLHVIDLDAVSRHDMAPFTPTWTMLGDRWVITLVPHTMKELLARLEAGGRGLAGEEDFRALQAGGLANAGSKAYVDLQAVLNLAYDTAVPVLQSFAKPNLMKGALPFPLDWALLPSARSMRPYFRSMGSFAECDGQTLKVAIHSPTGVLLPAAVLGGIGMMMPRRVMSGMTTTMVPPMRVDPEEDDDTQALLAEVRMQNLVEAVLAYRMNTGRLPASLEALLQDRPEGSDEPYLSRLGPDPWGNAYEYVVRDASKGQFEIRSLGKDGVPNTMDDLLHAATSEDK